MEFPLDSRSAYHNENDCKWWQLHWLRICTGRRPAQGLRVNLLISLLQQAQEENRTWRRDVEAQKG